MTYEEAVRWLREREEYAELVETSYISRDTNASAARFADSEEFEAVRKLLGSKKKDKMVIVDIGAGNGICSRAFAKLGHRVLSIDPDCSAEVGLGVVVNSSGFDSGFVTPIAGIGERLPLRTESVDCVYTRQAVHHFEDLKVALNEVGRVMKRGGVFLATREHVVESEEEKAAFLRDHVMQSLHGQENAFSVREYQTAIADAGLTLCETMGRFDSVINFYPGKEIQRRKAVVQFAREKKGLLGATAARCLPAIRKRVASHLSRFDGYPGRLYTFVAVKE